MFKEHDDSDWNCERSVPDWDKLSVEVRTLIKDRAKEHNLLVKVYNTLATSVNRSY